MPDQDTIHLLWTGGWDSTFRLLQLALMEGRRVRPHYVVDEGRASTLHEFRAMSAIRRACALAFPNAAGRILPTVVVCAADLAPDATVTARHAAIRREMKFGSQYEWLGRYALQSGLADLEIALEKEPEGCEPDEYQGMLLAELVGEGHGRRIRDDVGDERMLIFRPFRFPMLHLTKKDAGRIARENGFFELMQLTWFCHARSASGLPCGRCVPCRQTKEAGIDRRFAPRGPFPVIVRGHGLFVNALRALGGRRSSRPGGAINTELRSGQAHTGALTTGHAGGHTGTHSSLHG